jgi:hypothetical protein
MIPYIFNSVFEFVKTIKTYKISPADFSIEIGNSGGTSVNEYYTENKLDTYSATTNQNIFVSKKISELNIDYSDFSNFINFSSAEVRLNIFKNKIISYTQYSQSLVSSETVANSNTDAFISRSYDSDVTYYKEKINEIVNSFDGYESYLYNSEDYTYDLNNKQFLDSTYVSEQDAAAKLYDKNNRDSLVNNTPEYILLNSDNDEYLIFLSMVGHYFDNIYNYINNLPLERTAQNDLNETMTRPVIENMLQSFGWDLETNIENIEVSDRYLSNISQSISNEEIIRTKRNRVLVNLPQIYKTKGTEEAVKLLLSCYGIPSSLLSIREYGGVNYSENGAISYSQTEIVNLLNFIKNNEYLKIPYDEKTQTIEFKFSIKDLTEYTENVKVPIVTKSDNYGLPYDWQISLEKVPGQFLGKLHFDIIKQQQTFVVIGDYGANNLVELGVSSQLLAKIPEFIVTTGTIAILLVPTITMM